jgi:hypothetical protein
MHSNHRLAHKRAKAQTGGGRLNRTGDGTDYSENRTVIRGERRISLSIIIRLAGFALAATLAGMWILLMWPDVASHMSDARAYRHLALLALGAIAIPAVVIWPFWRLSDWLNPALPRPEAE